MEKTIDLYVKKEGAARENCFSTIGEAIEAMERIAPVPEEIAAELEKGRIYPSPVYEVTPFVVHIGAGEYREKLVLSRPNVTFLGEGRDKTVLVSGMEQMRLRRTEKKGEPSVLLLCGLTRLILQPDI